MIKNFKSKLIASVMTTAMVFSSAAAFAPVHAVNGTTTQFKKYLKVEEGANVPTSSFAFTVKAGTAKAASDTTRQINAGLNPEKVKVGQATFNKDSSKAESAPGVAADGKQIFVSDVNVDFTDVDFLSAGIYRYLITENNPSNSYFTKDDATKVLDVYVSRNDQQALVIDGYVLHGDPDAAITTGTDLTNKGKNTGFVNDYKSHDLEIVKKATGNQANPEDEFTYTLTIAGANPNTTLAVVTSSNDNDTKQNLETTTGTITKTIKLKAGDSYKVVGLNEGASYTVEETDKNHYELKSVEATGDNVNKDNTSVVKGDKTVADDSLTGNVKITFNNEKSGTVPTGIIFAVAPFAVGAFVLAAFIIVKMRRTAKQ